MTRQFSEGELERLTNSFGRTLRREYGDNVAIKSAEVTEGSPEHIRYNVTISHGGKGVEKEKVLDMMVLNGFPSPYSIDGRVTEEGEAHCDDLAELGRMMAAAYDN